MAKINLTPHQAFMLKMFDDGWGFKMYKAKNGSWCTFWSLRRKGLLGAGETKKTSTNLIAINRLTPLGKKALEQWKEKNGTEICS